MNVLEGFFTMFLKLFRETELFAFMIAQHKEFKKAIAKDEILLKKSKLMISRLKGVSKEIDKSFWKNLN